MIQIEQDVWLKLQSDRPTGEKLVARLAAPDITNRLLCAMDSAGIHHIIIALKEGEQEINDNRTRGIGAFTRELAVHGHETNEYIDIECRDQSGHSAFDIIAGEIAQELSGTAKQPAEIVAHILAKWKRFWGQLPDQILSREQQLGLFGELWFLSNWVLPRFGNSGVLAWRGPFGARHDFEWKDKSVEVKSTTNTRGRIHHVHGIEQLDPPQIGPLCFMSLQLREEGGATNNIPQLIERCHEKLINDADALGHFESALIEVGYSPIHDEVYANLSLRVLEELLFVVRGDFPRVNASSFSGGVPNGIERIEYEINLNSFDHLIVAREPKVWL